MTLLVAVSLFGLRPWEVDSTDPSVTVPLDLGAAVEEAVALPSPPPLALAEARPLPAAAPVSVGREVPPPSRLASRSAAAISAARVVAIGPASNPLPAPAPPPVPEPAPAPPAPVAPPAPAPVPAPVVVSAPAPQAPPLGEAPTTLVVSEGDEYELTFALHVEAPLPGEPPAEELIVQFTGEASELPRLGLRLRDDGSGTGHALWASGELVGGDRLLASLSAGEPHEATVHFRASAAGDGFYMVLLDGALVDASFGVDLIEEGSGSAAVELTPGASIADLSVG